jgi:tetratricopeptide (TPR) repeat protein
METILMLSGVKYNSTKQRPHHMAKYFAKKGYRVIYIGLLEESKIINEHEFNNISVNEILDKYAKKTSEGIIVIKRLFKNEYNFGLDDLIAKLEKHFIPKKVTVIVAFPDWIKHLGKVSKESKVIYDCMDDWESFSLDLDWGYKQEIIQNERKIASIADLVIASAKSLYYKMTLLNKKVYYLPNGVWNTDYHKLSKNKLPEDLIHIKKPIIFFMGAIAGWVDTELIEFLAKMRSDYSFVFIGNEVKQKLPVKANINFLGPKKYEELPLYLSYARVAIIPFKVNKLTAAVTPLKFYEYLSSGTPVVTTLMPDLIGLQGSKIAFSYNEFLQYLDYYVSMEENDYKQEIKKAKNTGSEYEWEQLLEPLCSFIEERHFNLMPIEDFISNSIECLNYHQQNIMIKNELLRLYSLQSNYDLCCNLFNFNEVLNKKVDIDYILLAYAYFKTGKFDQAIVLLNDFLNNNLLSVYIESLYKEKNNEIFIEIFMLKLSGDIYNALKLIDNLFLKEQDNPKLLGLLSGLYLDLGEYEISRSLIVDTLNNKKNFKIEEILDVSCIVFLIESLTKEKNYELAEEIALSLYGLSDIWEKKSIEILSEIYFSKHLITN